MRRWSINDVRSWLWFGSVALWAVSLLRWKFSDANLLDSGLKYGLANISLVNFSIDIPGLLLKNRIWTTWVVIAINLFAGIVFVFCAFAEEPIQKAWGCYPPGSTAYDLVYGVCPEFKSDDGLPTPVCDQRGVFCYQTHPKPFNTTVAITGQVVAAGAAIYVLSIKNKIMRL